MEKLEEKMTRGIGKRNVNQEYHHEIIPLKKDTKAHLETSAEYKENYHIGDIVHTIKNLKSTANPDDKLETDSKAFLSADPRQRYKQAERFHEKK